MDIAVIGAGGHSKVIQELVRSLKDFRLRAVFDDKYTVLMLENGIYTGPLSSVLEVLEVDTDVRLIIAIGSNEARKSVAVMLGLSSERYVSLIHETAVVSPSASIGRGTVIMANAVINAEARIGNHAIINTGAVVEHDTEMGDYVHIAPKAALTGGVRVREGAMLGAGSTVIPGTSIGEWAVIGAGATVIGDIPAKCTAVGTPAKQLSKMYERI